MHGRSENPPWGATKMQGELLKLGSRVAQSTVSIYMVPRRGRPLESSKTFLYNRTRPIERFEDVIAQPILGGL